MELSSQETMLETYSSNEEEDKDCSVNFVNNSGRKLNARPPRIGGQKDTPKKEFLHGKTMNSIFFE